MNPETIHQFCTGNKRADGSGRKCTFIKLNDSTGLKCYRTYNDAETSFGMQLIMHKLGMGPNCWGWHTVTFAGETYYCFMTEIVTVFNGYDFDVEALKEELRKLGFQHHDLCHFNVGRTPDGKIVPVDFGDMSYIHHQNEYNSVYFNTYSMAKHIDFYNEIPLS